MISPSPVVFVGLVTSALLLECTLQAQPVRVYLANDDHTDFFWSADGATYERVFQEMIDYYLDLADATSNNPAPYRSRFNCDGSYWLWVYEHGQPAARLRSCTLVVVN